MSQPTILMYNLENDKGSRLRLLCLKLHVRVRSVRPGEYGEPLSALAGLSAPTGAPADGPIEDEMLVFVNFDGNLLNRLLQQMRASRIPGVALKAVLTPTNMHWTSLQLHREIRQEHEAMHYGQPSVHEKSD
mgnify:CR=1 FL=1